MTMPVILGSIAAGAAGSLWLVLQVLDNHNPRNEIRIANSLVESIAIWVISLLLVLSIGLALSDVLNCAAAAAC